MSISSKRLCEGVFALAVGGEVRCWEENYLGGLGNGSTPDSSTPTTVTVLDSPAVAVAGLSGQVAQPGSPATPVDPGSPEDPDSPFGSDDLPEGWQDVVTALLGPALTGSSAS